MFYFFLIFFFIKNDKVACTNVHLKFKCKFVSCTGTEMYYMLIEKNEFYFLNSGGEFNPLIKKKPRRLKSLFIDIYKVLGVITFVENCQG